MVGLRIVFMALFLVAPGCLFSGTPPEAPNTVHHYQFSLPGFNATFDLLVKRFHQLHPGYRVQVHQLPTGTDDQHQFYLTHMKTRGSGRIDVLALDVIWMAEFARAGLLSPLNEVVPEEEWNDFFAASVQAGIFGETRYGVPLFVDSGVMYSRKDLLQKHGFSKPPATWGELVTMAETITQAEQDDRLYGFVWQGRQYEGLVCNFMEFLPRGEPWLLPGNGERLNRALIEPRLRFMRRLLTDGVSPPSVLAMAEESSRHVFQNGRAVFMRNWPYAWRLMQQPDSPVAGRVWMSPLPAVERGEAGRGTLGGFLLGMHRDTPVPVAARAWIAFLTQPDVQRVLWLKLGLTPARKSVLRGAPPPYAPPVNVLFEAMEYAAPRPAMPLYMPLSQSLQAYLNGGLGEVYTIDEAMRLIDADLQRLTRVLNDEAGT
ncbi:ABC transporter substrate-binding protein [Nitrospina sp. 32_T5]|uniref:ABC transporter substrate-binding protein n=1 Tax=unclassified Nitrospina TaxID=2638683 RepID=UPI003F9C52FF